MWQRILDEIVAALHLVAHRRRRMRLHGRPRRRRVATQRPHARLGGSVHCCHRPRARQDRRHAQCAALRSHRGLAGRKLVPGRVASSPLPYDPPCQGNLRPHRRREARPDQAHPGRASRCRRSTASSCSRTSARSNWSGTARPAKSAPPSCPSRRWSTSTSRAKEQARRGGTLLRHRAAASSRAGPTSSSGATTS